MFASRLRVKNWRNFRSFDVALQERQFLVGPNASGKSNFLDIFRFLRDVADPDGGGLQAAIKRRGGVSKVRCLAAREDPVISIDVELTAEAGAGPAWLYSLGVRQEPHGRRLPIVAHELVWKGKELIRERPDEDDKADDRRLTQTHLQQINANEPFRDVATFFQSVTYLHMVPQLLRFADEIQGRILERDPFGQGFLERVARTPERIRGPRLNSIQEALKIAVPQLQQLGFTKDEDTGRPHLQAMYSHWRPHAGWQREDQFSDGTLRLIALLWSLLEGDALLLLEEPELSLNSGIVAQLAPIIYRAQRRRRRQVIISTHSESLLTERGIDGHEVLMLMPAAEGTNVSVASDIAEVRVLLESGLTIADAVMSRMRPAEQLRLELPRS